MAPRSCIGTRRPCRVRRRWSWRWNIFHGPGFSGILADAVKNLDTGTPDSLAEAGKYVQIIEHRQGVRIACVEEIALRRVFIDAAACHRLGEQFGNSPYGRYVMQVAESAR
jgi:dTDP-glucose pyrophosphorylase